MLPDSRAFCREYDLKAKLISNKSRADIQNLVLGGCVKLRLVVFQDVVEELDM